MRLSLATLCEVPGHVRRPAYDVAGLETGIVHLGVGAFHRAHQAFFTDDAIEAAGGPWGIVGVSMRSPAVADGLARQDGLFSVEVLDRPRRRRIVGAMRRTLTLPIQPRAVTDAIAASSTRVVTLTITEKGYCLKGGALDLDHPDIAHDLGRPEAPRSAVGALVAGLAERRRLGGRPISVVSCDNLADNGARLGGAAGLFADRLDPGLARWIEAEIAFPQTMVDSIAPASDEACLARAEADLGLRDEAAVQREGFAQWVIEDRFAGPRPAWDRAGAEIVDDVAPYRRLKLHVLNATHSALAYLGLARGHALVREAIADTDLARLLDAMVEAEIAPNLPELPVSDYWRSTRGRFANPMVDHRLDQIAQDGAFKLAERIHPLMLANAASGRPTGRLAAVVRAWLERTAGGRPIDRLLDDPSLFSDAFRRDPRLRAAVLSAPLESRS